MKTKLLSLFVFSFCCCLVTYLSAQGLMLDPPDESSNSASEVDDEKIPDPKIPDTKVNLNNIAPLDFLNDDAPVIPLSTLHHHCDYANGDSLKQIAEALLSPRGKVVFSEGLDVLIIQDTPQFLEKIEASLSSLDKPVPQVQVEARVIEITLDKDTEKELSVLFEDTGLSSAVLHGGFFTLQTPGPTPSTGEGIRLDTHHTNNARDESVDGFIRFLITENKAKILSSPTIVAGRGSEASIITGEEVPIQTTQNQGGTVSTSTTFKRVGIKLKVTPLKIGADTVKLLVAPEVSSVNSFDNDGNPIVAIRNTRTTLTIKDGQTLVIGGLHREESSLIEKKIPFLGDIPYLGWFFRSTRDQMVKSMLVFYLKVDILEHGKQSNDVNLDDTLLKQAEDRLESKVNGEEKKSDDDDNEKK